MKDTCCESGEQIEKKFVVKVQLPLQNSKLYLRFSKNLYILLCVSNIHTSVYKTSVNEKWIRRLEIMKN